MARGEKSPRGEFDEAVKEIQASLERAGRELGKDTDVRDAIKQARNAGSKLNR